MENSIETKKDITDIIRAVLFSTLFALAFVLIFAIIIRWSSLENNVLMPVNIAIKLISLLIGILFAFKNPRDGILKGAISGLVFMLITYFIFAALSAFKNVSFNWIDFITLPIAGAISGIIAVNIKRRKT